MAQIRDVYRRSPIVIAILLSCAFVAAITYGDELRRAEDRIRDTEESRIEDRSRTVDSLPAELQQAPLPSALKRSAATDLGVRILDVRVVGDPADVAGFQMTGLLTELRLRCIGKLLTSADIRNIAIVFTARLVDRHFYLGFIVPSDANNVDNADAGVLTFRVSLGRIGELSVAEQSDLRFFSRRQVERALTVRAGDIFDYSRIYNDLYRLNAVDGLTLDAAVKARSLPDTEDRVANLKLTATDRLPLHAAFRSGNAGTDATGVTRHNVMLSYENLTRRYDAISIQYTSGEDSDEFESLSGAYELPIDFRRRITLRVFGGRSDTHIRNILDAVDTVGEEQFVGLQLSWKVVDTSRRLLTVSIGRVWRDRLDELRFDGSNLFLQPPVRTRVAPIDLGLAYVDRDGDRLNGYNQVSLNVVVNRPEWGGTSGSENFSSRHTARQYEVVRLSAGRHQLLSERGLMLSLFIDGQLSNEHLTSSEQTSAGGVSTVRGFDEDELLRDSGFVVNAEVLTQQCQFSLPGRSEILAARPLRLRGLLFHDYAYLKNNRSENRLSGDRAVAIGSAGVGVRLDVGDALSLQLDHGWPVDDTPESDGGGRTHVQLSIGF